MTTDPTTHWTDGAGPIDGNTDYGPPPLAAVWKPGEECHVALVDPPNPVFVTIHDSNGGSGVVQYVGSAPGTFPADVTDLVQGHDGVLTLTWNIGTGVSEPFVYHCAPPATTTTTVAPETTTTSVAPATTTSFDPGTPTSVASPTTVATVGVADHLPDTGFGNAELGIGAFGALGVGALFVLGARFWKAHR